jgi:hypothetical protein
VLVGNQPEGTIGKGKRGDTSMPAPCQQHRTIQSNTKQYKVIQSKKAKHIGSLASLGNFCRGKAAKRSMSRMVGGCGERPLSGVEFPASLPRIGPGVGG